MDEIIVRVSRTLASRERLRLLSILIASGEQTPSDLARALALTPSNVSVHIAKLALAGLIRRRHSGSWSYCVPESPYGETTLSGMTLAWLREILAFPNATRKACGLKQVRKPFSEVALRPLHGLIFDAATAFTDLRRLQILRFLIKHGQASAGDLTSGLRMSEWAVRRHATKLIRRGFMEQINQGVPLMYRVPTKCKTPVHSGLWHIVRNGRANVRY